MAADVVEYTAISVVVSTVISLKFCDVKVLSCHLILTDV